MPLSSVLDVLPFPAHEPAAQELVSALAALYSSPRQAAAVSAPFGIDELDLPPSLSPRDLWWEILRELARRGRIREVVSKAVDQFPNSPRSTFLSDLLKNKATRSSAEPDFKPDTPPSFDDRIKEPEALLFFDDLTMPVGRVPRLIKTLSRLLEIAPAVCLIRAENEFGQFYGTGLKIGSKTILTNHHVLFPKRSRSRLIQVDFGFDIDADGVSLPVLSLAAAPETIYGNDMDDWAIVEVARVPDEIPVIDILESRPPHVGDLTFILQHPNAQRKRMGFVRNQITDVTDQVIRYLTDTQPGSSGSPVFDAEGNLIALHHAGGRPIEVLGRPPVAKNEGIRISRIFEGLRPRQSQL